MRPLVPVGSKVKVRVNVRMWDQVGGLANAQVRWNARSGVGTWVWRRVCRQTWSRVWAQVRADVKDVNTTKTPLRSVKG